MIEITHPHDPDLSFDAFYYKGNKEIGERGYSLGQPAEPAGYYIKRVFYRDEDITSFVKNHCDFKIEEWERDIND